MIQQLPERYIKRMQYRTHLLLVEYIKAFHSVLQEKLWEMTEKGLPTHQ
jgi:hypothetical protein